MPSRMTHIYNKTVFIVVLKRVHFSKWKLWPKLAISCYFIYGIMIPTLLLWGSSEILEFKYRSWKHATHDPTSTMHNGPYTHTQMHWPTPAAFWGSWNFLRNFPAVFFRGISQLSVLLRLSAQSVGASPKFLVRIPCCHKRVFIHQGKKCRRC